MISHLLRRSSLLLSSLCHFLHVFEVVVAAADSETPEGLSFEEEKFFSQFVIKGFLEILQVETVIEVLCDFEHFSFVFELFEVKVQIS